MHCKPRLQDVHGFVLVADSEEDEERHVVGRRSNLAGFSVAKSASTANGQRPMAYGVLPR